MAIFCRGRREFPWRALRRIFVSMGLRVRQTWKAPGKASRPEGRQQAGSVTFEALEGAVADFDDRQSV